MCGEVKLIKCEDVVAIVGGCIRILQESSKMVARAGEVCWVWRGMEGVLPGAVIVQLGS